MIVVLVLLSLASVPASQVVLGQTTVYDEPFNYSDGTTAPGDGSWSLSNNGLSPDVFSVQSNALQLTDASDGGSGGVEFETKSIDISNFSTVDFSLDVSEDGDHESSDFVDVEFSTDGGSTFTKITDWNGNGSTSHTLVGDKPNDSDWGSTTVTRSGLAGSQLVLRVTMRNNAGSEDIRLDNVEVTSSPTVQFTAGSGTVNETEGTTTLSIEILSPPSGTSVTADVVFNGGNSSASSGDVSSFGTKSVTFPSGAADGNTQSVTVSLSSDGAAEGSETALFDLENVSGGSATAASPSQFDLTIQDAVSNHSGDVFITEIMPDPDAVSDGDGEYVELYNATASDIDLSGWSIEDGDGDSDELGVTVPARGFVVLCKNDETGSNGNLRSCDFDYANRIDLENTGDVIKLLDGNSNEVDRVNYDGGTNWPNSTGAAVVFTGTTDNNTGSNWAAAPQRERGFGLGGSETDKGSPGRNGTNQTLQPTTEVTGAAGWRMLSAPVGSITPNDLAAVNLVQGIDGNFPGADANLYQWPGGETSNTSWNEPSSATTDLTSNGQGFIWYVFGTAGTDFTDTPPFTLSVPGQPRTASVTTGSLGEGFHLLGNPYAQAFDISELNLAAQNFQTTIQIWDPSADSYQQVLQSSTSEDFIGPYQGFFVERTSGGSATLTFDAVGRRADPMGLKSGEEGPPHVEFRLVGRDGGGSVLTRDEALTLHAPEGAAAGWDVHDATKLTPLSGRYATAAFRGPLGDETRLQSVASIPSVLPEEGVELPVSLQLQGTDPVDTFVLSWPTWRQVPEEWSVTLHDTATDSTVDLRSRASYAFSLSESKAQSVPPPRSPLELPSQLQARAQSGNSRFVLTVERSSIPVELAALHVTLSDGAAQLTWTTASETNNAGFHVEHRGPNADRFASAGFVEGHGTTDTPQQYRFRTDPLDPGRHVFRLRQVDLDGTATRSDTVSTRVPLGPEAQMDAAPTPLRSQTTVTLRLRTRQEVEVALYDVLGRRVRILHDAPLAPDRPHRLQMDARGLSSGLYLLRAHGERFQATRRVTVVR